MSLVTDRTLLALWEDAWPEQRRDLLLDWPSRDRSETSYHTIEMPVSLGKKLRSFVAPGDVIVAEVRINNMIVQKTWMLNLGHGTIFAFAEYKRLSASTFSTEGCGAPSLQCLRSANCSLNDFEIRLWHDRFLELEPAYEK